MRQQPPSSSETPPARQRVIIADDHQMVLDSLSGVLSTEYEVVGTATSGVALDLLLHRCSADCLLLDLWMPEANGLELIPRARLLQPAIKIVVVTMMNDRVLADAALDAGAHGFVPKDAGIIELIMAVREVLAGRRYVSPRVPKTSHRMGLTAAHPGLARLTPREHQILLALGEGCSEVEVGRKVGLSKSAITFHKHHLMTKLGASNDARLRQLAILLRAVSSEQ